MTASTWLDLLPPAFREGTQAGDLLAAFEAVFTDSSAFNGTDQPAFEELIGSMDRWFTPIGTHAIPETRPEFLEWLSGLLAVGLRLDWDDHTKRRVLAEAVPLFRMRGTKTGLQRMLQLHLTTGSLAESLDGLEESGDALVRVLDTEEELGFEPPPFYFAVRITLRHNDAIRQRRDAEIAIALIEQEKPAHTFYGLQLDSPRLRLGLPSGHPSRWELGDEHSSVLGSIGLQE